MSVKRRKPKPEANLRNIVIKSLIGSAIGTAAFFALTALLSFICFKNDSDPVSYKFFILAAGAAAGFLCGFSAAKPLKKRGAVIGAVSTMPMYFIVVCVALLAVHSGIGAVGWVMCGVMLASGAVGGITAVI